MGLGLFTPRRDRLRSLLSSCFWGAYLEVWVLTTLHLCLSCSCCASCILSLIVGNLFYWSSGGFPGGTGGKEPNCQCRRRKRHGFDPCGWEDPLEEDMTTHPSILAWRIPWTEESDRLQSMGSQRVGHS